MRPARTALESVYTPSGVGGLRLDCLGFVVFPALDIHSPMLRAERRADLIDPFRDNAEGIAAGVGGTFRLEVAGFLFLGPIRRAAIVAPALDIQAGMGQRPQAFGDLRQQDAQELVRHGVAQLAFEADLLRDLAVKFPMSGVWRQNDVAQFMHENAENFDGIGNIGADDDFKASIV